MSKNDDEKISSNMLNYIRSKAFYGKMFLIIAASIFVYWSLTNILKVEDFLGNVFSLFAPIFYGLCIAFILNLFMRPLESLWERLFKKTKLKFRLKRVVCMIISILLVISVISMVLFLVLPEIVQTVYSFIYELPVALDNIESKLNELEKNFSIYNISLPELNTNELESYIAELLPQMGFDFVNKTFTVTSYIFSSVVNFVLAFVFAIYMLIQKEMLCLKIKKLLFAIVPVPKAEKVISWADLTNKTFTKFATGQMIEAIILFVLCFLGMLILRIPYSFVISVLIAFTALIPVFGAIIGAVIGAFLIVTVSSVKAIWFIIFVVVLQQIEGNLIYPKVVGKSVGLPGILVLAAVTIGGKAFGVIGILLSVPMFSIAYFGFKVFVENRLKLRKINFDM